MRPPGNLESYSPPPPPNYSDARCWAALPDRRDSADVVPQNSGLQENQVSACVDVFYIHPTTYYKAKSWNADVRDQELNAFTDRTAIRHQASVFNEACRVYAPRYRQATLYSFFDTEGNGDKARSLAYTDVKRAFEFYLEHFNDDRPIVIASHSQGTWHAIRLLQDFFDPSPVMRSKLVCAYLIGGPLKVGDFVHIPACDSAMQTGCYVAWNTVLWGESPRFEGLACTNPLNWCSDTCYVSSAHNIGGVPVTFDRIDVHIADAKCAPDGGLWIHAPDEKGYWGRKNYHIADYSLFYMNIRENVRQRVDRFIMLREVW